MWWQSHLRLSLQQDRSCLLGCLLVRSQQSCTKHCKNLTKYHTSNPRLHLICCSHWLWGKQQFHQSTQSSTSGKLSISASCHSYPHNVVFHIFSLQVLVHGEATVMARLKAALLREYEDNQVYTHMGSLQHCYSLILVGGVWGRIIYHHDIIIYVPR